MKDSEIRYKLPKAFELMSHPVIALTEEHSVFDALRVFNKYKFSAIPIVEEITNKLVGVLSEGDCLKKLSETLFYDEMSEEKIGSFLNKSVNAITKDMDIFQLEGFFKNHGIRHAPVIQDDRVVGTVSRSDILVHLEKFALEVLKYRHDVKDPLELSKYKEFDTRAEDLKENHRFEALN